MFMWLLGHGARSNTTNSDDISAFDYAKRHCKAISNAMSSAEDRQKTDTSSTGAEPKQKPPRKREKKATTRTPNALKRRHSADEDPIENKPGSASAQRQEHSPRGELPNDHRALPERRSKRLKKDWEIATQ
jgi:hypothetical protein